MRACRSVAVEPLLRGHPDERPTPLEKPLDTVNLNGAPLPLERPFFCFLRGGLRSSIPIDSRSFLV